MARRRGSTIVGEESMCKCTRCGWAGARQDLVETPPQDDCQQHGVTVVVVTDPIEAGPEGTFRKQVKQILAQYEKAKTLERAKRGMRGRAHKGHPNGGQVPLGYRYVMEPHRGAWEIDEEEAALVRRIYALCLAGRPVRTIAHQLTDERVPTRLDRRPKSGGRKRNQAGVWSCSSVHHMLRNAAYTGTAYRDRLLWAQGTGDENRLSPQRPGRVDSPRGPGDSGSGDV